MRPLSLFHAVAAVAACAFAMSGLAATPQYFSVVDGAGPHDVAAAPAPGPVYYTAQRTGRLGILDPATRKVEEVDLGPNSAPHGVVVGPDGAPWITDGGQNAIVRVDPRTRQVRTWPLPPGSAYANLNTLTFDKEGNVWFTGQAGYYGRVDLRQQYGEGVAGTARARPLRHHDRAVRRRLLRVARRQSHRPHRRRHRRGDGDRTADARPGRAPRVARFARAHLGQLLEHRARRHVRSGRAHVARVETARQCARVFRLGGRSGQGVADRLDHQCAGAIRSGHREVRRIPVQQNRAPTCGRCWGERGKRGAPNPVSIGW